MFGTTHRPQGGLVAYVMQGTKLGFDMGIPRVGFSHTVPEPSDTVPILSITDTEPSNQAVSYNIIYINFKYCNGSKKLQIEG